MLSRVLMFFFSDQPRDSWVPNQAVGNSSTTHKHHFPHSHQDGKRLVPPQHSAVWPHATVEYRVVKRFKKNVLTGIQATTTAQLSLSLSCQYYVRRSSVQECSVRYVPGFSIKTRTSDILETQTRHSLSCRSCIYEVHKHPYSCVWPWITMSSRWHVDIRLHPLPYSYMWWETVKSPRQHATTGQNFPNCELSVKSTQVRLCMTDAGLPAMY